MATKRDRTKDGINNDGFVFFPTAGDKLRKGEESLLIPNRLRRFAFNVCDKEMSQYEDCLRAWGYKGYLGRCTEKKKNMEACVNLVAEDPDAWEEVKTRYLIDRDDYQEFLKRHGKERQAEIDGLLEDRAAKGGEKA